ncbi:acyl-[acyl-carrier-protein] thioesterase [Breznakiella homolactica]|uniref:Acyl-ACP thioesterase n=1 Tax=Breznakiella homolactica TaxID=2798577 RepID=A0A7T7XPL2_9SPIR|nr:acyl-ACP thioesterase domain-containing protein [Breznakiella homolactica]QQO10133.1 hypothetical protein JFL75_04225 [Breznakiella homolactica]
MYTLDNRVCTSHTDAEGRLKLVSAIDMMQDCSQMWMESEPVLELYFRDNRISQMLVSRQIDVIRLPLYGEKLRVSTSVYECRDFYGYRNTVIYDENGEPCVVSWSTGVFVSLEQEKIVRIPGTVFDQVVMDEKVEMEYLGKKISLPDVPAENHPPVHVRRHDIDFNRHMNNAKYVQIAWEYLPRDFTVSRMRIEYKTAAKYGDVLHPRMVTGIPGKIFVVLTNSEESPYAVMEFCGG